MVINHRNHSIATVVRVRKIQLLRPQSRDHVILVFLLRLGPAGAELMQ